jgi:microcystin-dependent protein
MAETPILGTIFIFAGNFAPRGYALCQGQLMSVSQNTALFSILGTTYGGDGQQTFGLPDLRGRAGIGTGQGPGMANVQLGESAGTQNVTILTGNMPPHNHLVSVNGGAGTQTSATNNFLATATDPGTGNGIPSYETTAAPGATLNPQSVTLAGNGLPLSVQNPYLGLNFIIATQGIYPSRN